MKLKFLTQIKYRDLHQIVSLVELPNKIPIIRAYVEHASEIAKTPGSRKKHQAWDGGYLDHIVYATNYALMLHNLHRNIGFEPDHDEGDIALVMLLHDFGKIVRYRKVSDGWDYVDNPNDAEYSFFEKAITEFGFKLTSQQLNALEFVHGEGAKYTPKGRLMLPLATICHEADVWNARYCPNNPLSNGKDPWPSAYRHSEKRNLVKYIKDLKKLRK